ncbi:MAG: hypothetical protein HYT99_01750 [Candidatus Tectomicrobia bacterium]|nr:hypothetical protein [Candidatus Tectomicrobia bacterium]
MADVIKVVDYYYITSPDKPGAGAKMLDPFRKAGVSFLAVHAFPEGKRVQVDFVPVKGGAFLRAARRARLRVSKKKKAFLVQGTDRAGALAGVMARLGAAKINVTAVTGLCAGKRRFALIFWVKPKDQRAAARALGAKA